MTSLSVGRVAAGRKTFANRVYQLIGRDRLAQETGDLQVGSRDGGSSDDDDRDMPGHRMRGDLLLHDEPTDPRQQQIENHEIGR